MGFLDIKELLLCGQVSKRLRRIANDESLWINLNLYEKKVPYDFIEKALGNGCQYLSLAGSGIQHLIGKSESPYNLKYLNMSQNMSQTVYKKKYQKLSQKVMTNSHGLPKMVQNCTSLQKMSVATLPLDSDDIQYICQNGQTLEDLELEYCNFRTKSIQDLLTNCAHLTELNFKVHRSQPEECLLDPQIQALVDNLTPTVLKVGLNNQKNVKDEHVKKLVERCNKITHLNLSFTGITNDSVQIIVKHLTKTLEKFDLCGTMHTLDIAAMFKLKSMPTLKTLICEAYGNTGSKHMIRGKVQN